MSADPGEEPFRMSDDVSAGHRMVPPDPSMRRILIAGSAGAGKSTMAREISERLGLPYTELDSLYHGPAWTPRAAFRDDVERIVRGDAWVSEWQYRAVRPVLLERAQLLIALDYSRPRIMARLVRRTLSRRLRRQDLWNGNREPSLSTFFTDPDHIVRWAWNMYAINRTRMRELERDSPEGLVVRRFGSPREAARWLAALGPE